MARSASRSRLFALRLAVCPRPPASGTFAPEMLLPRASRPLQSTTTHDRHHAPRRDLAAFLGLPRTTLRPYAVIHAMRLSWGLRPRRDISQRRRLPTGAPTLRPDAPSSAFHTPTTVSSAAGLAGLFHPARHVQGSRSSGVLPSRGAAPGFPGRFPPVVERLPSSRLPATPTDALDFRALLTARVRSTSSTVKSPMRRAPLELFLPPGSSPSCVTDALAPFTVHDLRHDVPPRRDP